MGSEMCIRDSGCSVLHNCNSFDSVDLHCCCHFGNTPLLTLAPLSEPWAHFSQAEKIADAEAETEAIEREMEAGAAQIPDLEAQLAAKRKEVTDCTPATLFFRRVWDDDSFSIGEALIPPVIPNLR